MQTAEMSFVQGQAEQQDNLYFTVLFKSYRLQLLHVVLDLCACRN